MKILIRKFSNNTHDIQLLKNKSAALTFKRVVMRLDIIYCIYIFNKFKKLTQIYL